MKYLENILTTAIYTIVVFVMLQSAYNLSHATSLGQDDGFSLFTSADTYKVVNTTTQREENSSLYV